MLDLKPVNDLDHAKIYQSLIEQQYATIPFDVDSKAIDNAMAAFMRFLDEPEDIKKHIDFSIAPLHRRGDVGYKHREAQDHIYNDDKEFFHFHPALLDMYKDFLSTHPVVNDFVNLAYPIWLLAYQTIEQILLGLEAQCPGVRDKVFATDEPVHILLRFLKYEWQSSGKYLAKPHYDAGSFTLAIAESCPGLRIGDGPETLTPIAHQDKNALFFLSSNYQKFIHNDRLKAGWHDVVQLDETIIGKPFARWALVAFVEWHNIEALPREETHKWFK